MRTTLVPSMLNTLAGNLHRGVAEAKLFELSNTFEPRAKGELPEEHPMLCVGLYGPDVDFYTVKEIGTWLAAAFGVDCKAEEGGRGLLPSRPPRRTDA